MFFCSWAGPRETYAAETYATESHSNLCTFRSSATYYRIPLGFAAHRRCPPEDPELETYATETYATGTYATESCSRYPRRAEVRKLMLQKLMQQKLMLQDFARDIPDESKGNPRVDIPHNVKSLRKPSRRGKRAGGNFTF